MRAAAALKRDLARRRAWWGELDPRERRERQSGWAARFAGLTIERQLEVNTASAHRSIRFGVSPAARHLLADRLAPRGNARGPAQSGPSRGRVVMGQRREGSVRCRCELAARDPQTGDAGVD